jgi:hypothetical protein
MNRKPEAEKKMDENTPRPNARSTPMKEEPPALPRSGAADFTSKHQIWERFKNPPDRSFLYYYRPIKTRCMHPTAQLPRFGGPLSPRPRRGGTPPLHSSVWKSVHTSGV